MRKVLLSLLLAGITTYSNAQNSRDTVHVYFDIAVPTIGDQEMSKLDVYAYHGNLPVNKKYGIIGYADYLGNDISNQTLSERRANNVSNYLQGLGVNPDSIQIVIGKGTIKRDVLNGNDGYKEDRRVDIIIGGIPTPPKPPTPAKPRKIKIVDKTKKEPQKPKATPKIDVSNIKKDETLVLDNIYFSPGSHVIRVESIPQLMAIVQLLDDNPTLKIQIEGHICCNPNVTDAYDFDTKDHHLSRNRAKYIYDYLVDYGINANRLSYEGFGASKPLVFPEKNKDDENKNRRVEIRVIDK